jgi:glutamate synthase domain-containing protein 3
MHACGYMTGGTVLILGDASHNLGSGMTGGVLYCRQDNGRFVNDEYLERAPMSDEDEAELLRLLKLHRERTRSRTARALIVDWQKTMSQMALYLPRAEAARRREARSSAA